MILDSEEVVQGDFEGEGPRRLYPAYIPLVPNEARNDEFRVEITEDCGYTLTALRDFKAGDLLFGFTGFVLPYQTLYTLQQAPGMYIHDEWVMGRVLHSCEPNSACDMQTRTFTALKDIPAGKTITMDYESTEDYLFRRFSCRCGSPGCRGEIKGRLATN